LAREVAAALRYHAQVAQDSAAVAADGRTALVADFDTLRSTHSECRCGARVFCFCFQSSNENIQRTAKVIQ
jgi:hypothetical protein